MGREIDRVGAARTARSPTYPASRMISQLFVRCFGHYGRFHRLAPGLRRPSLPFHLFLRFGCPNPPEKPLRGAPSIRGRAVNGKAGNPESLFLRRLQIEEDRSNEKSYPMDSPLGDLGHHELDWLLKRRKTAPHGHPGGQQNVDQSQRPRLDHFRSEGERSRDDSGRHRPLRVGSGRLVHAPLCRG